MTLIELKNEIEEIVKNSRGVRSFLCGSFYDLNDKSDIKYPLFNLQFNDVTGVNDSIYNINMTLVLLDRVVENKDNELTIQSDSIIYMNEILNNIDEIDGSDVIYGYQYNLVSEKLNDNVAGCFVTLNIQVDNLLGDCLTY